MPIIESNVSDRLRLIKKCKGTHMCVKNTHTKTELDLRPYTQYKNKYGCYSSVTCHSRAEMGHASQCVSHTSHEVQAIAESSISEGWGVESSFGFVLTLSARLPDLHSHSWVSALWRDYTTGDNRRTYICLFCCDLWLGIDWMHGMILESLFSLLTLLV